MAEEIRQASGGRNRTLIQIFLYLQLLDLLTTLVGFKLGATEASPFIRMLLHLGPATAVLISKLIALSLAVLCVLMNRPRLIRWVSYWYAVLVVWNLTIILSLRSAT